MNILQSLAQQKNPSHKACLTSAIKLGDVVRCDTVSAPTGERDSNIRRLSKVVLRRRRAVTVAVTVTVTIYATSVILAETRYGMVSGEIEWESRERCMGRCSGARYCVHVPARLLCIPEQATLCVCV